MTTRIGMTPDVSLLLRERKEIWARLIARTNPKPYEEYNRLAQVEAELSRCGVLPPKNGREFGQ